MATVSLPIERPRPVRRMIRRLRAMLHLYVLAEGVAAVLLVLGGAFWLALGIDWSYEPSSLVRGVMWCFVMAAVGWFGYRYLLSRVLVSVSDSQLALLLERRYPNLQESLVTTVDATSDEHPEPLSNVALLRRLITTVESSMRGIEILPVFRFFPVAWKTVTAAVVWLLILWFALAQPEAFGFWLERMQLSQQLWPRQVQLSVVGVTEQAGQKVIRVARDDNLELQVEAALTDGHVSPERVEIRYLAPDGRHRKHTMVKVGEALPGRDDGQRFRFTFNDVSEDMSFEVIGGDDRIRDLLIKVVERPQIGKIVLDCIYPRYLDRGPENVPVSGRVEIEEGTYARCRVTCTKELAKLHVYDTNQQLKLPATVSSENLLEAEFELGQIDQDRVLLVSAHDTDGVESRDPYRVVVSVIPDMPPEVTVGLSGIGSAVTAQAIIPIKGKISDEYGLDQIWYESQIGNEPPQRWDVEGIYQRGLRHTRLPALDLALTDSRSGAPLIDAKPGTQLALSVHATDYYDLNDLPRSGRSHRFLLDVVTESKLREILEKRELTLRQRFESIYEKMIATRELLQRVEIDLDENLEPEQIQRARQRDRLRVGGGLQNVAQLSHETLGVAEGFEGIVTELENNRIDTEELTSRLGNNIASPLRAIAEEMLPDLQSSLKLLEASFVDEKPSASLRKKAIVQSDAVIEAMKQVLDRMLELESYNELVALLRTIVAEQKELQKETKQQRRQKLRDILGDD